jgi:mRNA interferase MazF
MNSFKIRRGDVFYVSKYPTCGSEQRSARPGIIVSSDSFNARSAVVEVVYLTCQEKKPMPTHVQINSGDRPSVALCEQITTVAVERLGSFKCHLTAEEMAQIDQALAASVGITAQNIPAKEPAPLPERSNDDRLLALVCLRYLQRVVEDHMGQLE